MLQWNVALAKIHSFHLSLHRAKADIKEHWKNEEARRIMRCWPMMQAKLLSLMSHFIKMKAVTDVVLNAVARGREEYSPTSTAN